MPPNGTISTQIEDTLLQLNLDLKGLQKQNVNAKRHGDLLLGTKKSIPVGLLDDLRHVLTLKNAPVVADVLKKFITTHQLDMAAAAPLVGSLPNNSVNRRALVDKQVAIKYDRMLHPPLTYLGDAFQYRTADGKFNSALHPHLGQAGAPYAKTVPAKTHPLGAMPDPGDIFDKLMARQESRPSRSGLSAMLIYHATIIIHDIFRTNDSDKNISDSSSYLDLSPLYGYTDEMVKKVRDGRYKLGLLKPDVFAEDRLLRQPPGVCILLVMYNRYHNYAATQLRRINENGRFSIPEKYAPTLLEAAARHFCDKKNRDAGFQDACNNYNVAWKDFKAEEPPSNKDVADAWKKTRELNQRLKAKSGDPTKITQEQYDQKMREIKEPMEKKEKLFKNSYTARQFNLYADALKKYIPESCYKSGEVDAFETAYTAAWDKLDDDLFNTARLITCGMYIQISIHDYLRALMGFHQFNTDFTLEPRLEIDHKNVSRGIGNQVSVEFNLLYRFHCAISSRDEAYTEEFMKEQLHIEKPRELSLQAFLEATGKTLAGEQPAKIEPWYQEFGLDHRADMHFRRDPITELFDDKQMVDTLIRSMDDPISNFGPRNTPRCLKPVEIMGIIQARKWGIGTLNDFREFFGMHRHDTFESITANTDIQDALRDLYEHPDQVELYPGVFCESDSDMSVDPGPSDVSSALWAAIFSDAITLVRSDRFYTVDWNTQSLTSWGMKEVTADPDILKSSVFHRLIQRAFPGWFPYDSIRFFHPFYTGQTNARFAEAQGYARDFKMQHRRDSTPDKPMFDITKSSPRKPTKPLYIKDYNQIEAILMDKSFDFIHPALKDVNNFPPAIRGMIKAATEGGGEYRRVGAPYHPPLKKQKSKLDEYIPALKGYFAQLMEKILKRESIVMSSSTYQIDAVRDFAIPVVARYISDFLGFGHLVDEKKNQKAQFTENEIYRHITNCQIFMSYTADETKLLKRRAEFRKSFEFLYDRILNSNVAEARKWTILQRRRDNPMSELGYQIAERILRHEKTAESASTVLVFVALNAAHNAVLSFTSVMDFFFKDLYKHENSTWLKIQGLAFKEDDSSMEALTALVLEADRQSVCLPTIRYAQTKRTIEGGDEPLVIEAGQTIILDIAKASPPQKNIKPTQRREFIRGAEFLPFRSSITDDIAGYHPKHLAIMGLTSMVKFFAQMKNLRRGHDAQGRVKKVNISASAEGYSNYMAPMRIDRIAKEAQALGGKAGQKLYTDKPLQPESDTYMNPEWDEMLPFPTTWKLRFDGFGKSTYTTIGKDGQESLLHVPRVFDDAPPFYQPRGASHTGGIFGDVNTSSFTMEQVGAGAEQVSKQRLTVQEVSAQEVSAGAAEPAAEELVMEEVNTERVNTEEVSIEEVNTTKDTSTNNDLLTDDASKNNDSNSERLVTLSIQSFEPAVPATMSIQSLDSRTPPPSKFEPIYSTGCGLTR